MNLLSIGNFDGVHLGHQVLIERARKLAGEGQVVVVTFEPHPSSFLRDHEPPERLMTALQRRETLISCGADKVRELVPSAELLGMPPRSFIEWLREEIPFDVIVEGDDFRFGKGRSAGLPELIELGETLGFTVDQVAGQDVELEDQTTVRVCSTLIRWLLAQGRVVDVARALGRPYRLAGTVVSGDQRGRTIGFPTANLDCGDLMLPGDGVYAGIASLPDGTRHPAAVSVGVKPTFGVNARIAEVHLIGHDGPVDDYGWALEVDLLRWLRGQARFNGVDDLLKRITLDCAETERCVQEQLVR